VGWRRLRSLEPEMSRRDSYEWAGQTLGLPQNEALRICENRASSPRRSLSFALRGPRPVELDAW